jgi:hypothetical protein
MDPYFGATRPYYKVIRVEGVPCVMMRNTILKILKYQKVYKKFVFKNVGG